jgi:hypothetical protein
MTQVYVDYDGDVCLYSVIELLDRIPCLCVHGMTHAITGEAVLCERCTIKAGLEIAFNQALEGLYDI